QDLHTALGAVAPCDGHAAGSRPLRMTQLRRRLLLVGLALGLYLLCAWLSIGFLRSPDDVALIWLPAGVALALAILIGGVAGVLILLVVPLMHLLLAPVSGVFLLYSAAAN